MAAREAAPQPGAPVPMAAARLVGAAEPIWRRPRCLPPNPVSQGPAWPTGPQRPLAVPADGGPHQDHDRPVRAGRRARPPRGSGVSPPRHTCGQPSPIPRRCCCLPGPAHVFHDTQFVGETLPGDRRRGRGVRAATRGGLTRSGSNANCAAAARSKAVIGGTRTTTSPMRYRGKSPPEPGPGKRSRPHPGVHGRRHRGGCARPARTRPSRTTWASSPGTSQLDGGQAATIPDRFTVPLPASGDNRALFDHRFEADLPRHRGVSDSQATRRSAIRSPAGIASTRRTVRPSIRSTRRRTPTARCTWQEGGPFIPGTKNDFGGSSTSEYGPLLQTVFPAAGHGHDYRALRQLQQR